MPEGYDANRSSELYEENRSLHQIASEVQRLQEELAQLLRQHLHWRTIEAVRPLTVIEVRQVVCARRALKRIREEVQVMRAKLRR